MQDLTSFPEIPGPTRGFHPPYDEEDYSDQYGSAEQETDDDMSNTVAGRNSWGFSGATPGPPVRGTFHSASENQAQVPPAKGGNRLSTGSASTSLKRIYICQFLLLFTVHMFWFQ